MTSRTTTRDEPKSRKAGAVDLGGVSTYAPSSTLADDAATATDSAMVLANDARQAPQSADGLGLLRLLTSPSELGSLDPAVSRWFGGFIEHFVAHAVAAGHRALCIVRDGVSVGVGLGDPEASVGTVFAAYPGTRAALRHALGLGAVFTEHKETEELEDDFVLETYDVLETSEPVDIGFDAARVARMTHDDLSGALALESRVQGARDAASLRAALEVGDIGFVARNGGEVVGHGLLTVVGPNARLHSLVVAPTHRGRGIGTALTRARLVAAMALGARRFVVEIATWNVVCRRIALRAGFSRVGTMWLRASTPPGPARRGL